MVSVAMLCLKSCETAISSKTVKLALKRTSYRLQSYSVTRKTFHTHLIAIINCNSQYLKTNLFPSAVNYVLSKAEFDKNFRLSPF